MLHFNVLFVVIFTAATISFVNADFSNEEQLERILQNLKSQQEVEGSEKTDAFTKEENSEQQHDAVFNLETFKNTNERSAESSYDKSLYTLSKNQQQNSNLLNNLVLNPAFKSKQELKEQRLHSNQHRFNQGALEKLFSKKKQRNSLLSNLNNHQYTEGSSGNRLDLEKYSKLYVVLNPRALNKKRAQKKREVPRLSDLVSDVVSLIRQRKEEKTQLKEYESYNKAKGFVVDLRPSQARRWSRDDDRRDDGLDEFPKRPRHSYRGGGGGGGGGSGGRTSIPYVRQRGDIYEKEE